MTTSMHDILPWHTFEAPGTVSLYGGGYMRPYRFHGTDLGSSSEADRVRANNRLSDVLRSKDHRWCWHIEGQNRRVQKYERGTYQSAAATLLDATRAEMMSGVDSQYRMDHYVTFTQEPPPTLRQLLASAVTSGQSASLRAKQLEEFRRECDHFAKQMRGPCKIEALDDDDTATYLHSTISTQYHRVRAAEHPILSVSLGDERFQRGNGVHRLGQNFIAFLTLGGFPPHSSPHLLSALTRKTYEFRWVTRWIGMARAGAQALMAAREEKALGGAGYMKDYLVKKLLKEPEGAGGKRVNRLATKMAEQAGRAQESLTDRGYGMQTTTFILWEKDFHKFQRNVSDLKATLQDHGLIVREEHVEPVKVWRMSLPGVRDAGRRTYPVSSRSCVDISAFDEVWTGRGFDHHLAKVTGVHRSWMRTADPVPHSIDTDAPGGAAHAVLFGRTGQAAKSTFANHLGLQFGWPGSQIISISVGRSELGPVLLSGGVVYKLGDHNSPNRLQPLLRADAPEGALQASEWLQLCIEEQGLQATPDRVEKLDKAVALRGADAPQRRTMTELVGNLHSLDPALAQALLPYTSGNAYGHIFDGNSGAELERKPWTMFDISQLIDLRPAAVVPAVAAITNITRGWFAVGRPTLVMLDECQFYLRYERARVAVQRILDTDRKNCVRVLLITQTPAHLCAFPDLLPSIRSACDTVFYGPDPKANESAEDYAKFGVGEAELRAISELPLGSYLQRNQFGSRAFALNPSDIALTLTGLSSPTELALLEQLHAECEGDSDKMLMRLLETQSTRNNDMAAKARKLLGWIDAEKKSA